MWQFLLLVKASVQYLGGRNLLLMMQKTLRVRCGCCCQFNSSSHGDTTELIRLVALAGLGMVFMSTHAMLPSYFACHIENKLHVYSHLHWPHMWAC